MSDQATSEVQGWLDRGQATANPYNPSLTTKDPEPPKKKKKGWLSQWIKMGILGSRYQPEQEDLPPAARSR